MPSGTVPHPSRLRRATFSRRAGEGGRASSMPTPGTKPAIERRMAGHRGAAKDDIMDQPLAFIGESQPLGFFALIIIGGLAGWIAGKIVGSRHWIFTNILIGVAGSYVG